MNDSANSNSLFPEALLTRIRETGIIAVVVIDHPDDARPLAETLLEGGLRAIELTLRTPAAFDALENIRQHCPDILAGLGTVLTPDQVRQARDAGAEFAVAPGLNADVVETAREQGLPFGPGIMTPSEVEKAVTLGCRTLKFFPAEPAGGIPYLKALNGPYGHLDLGYVPLGGLKEENFMDYLALPHVPAVGGSWLAPRDDIRNHEWAAIRDRTKRSIDRVRAGKSGK